MKAKIDESGPKRVHKSTEQRADEILFAASQIFADHGYQGADVQAIADLACVGKGTVYRYFSTKEALFKAAIHYQMQLLRSRLEAVRDINSDPLSQLYESMRAYLHYFDQHPEVIELFTHERAEFGREVVPIYFQIMNEQRAESLSIFAEIQQRYPVRPDLSTEELYTLCGELLHGSVYMAMAMQPEVTAVSRVDQVFSFYIHGIMQIDNPLKLIQRR
jgi:AcrR family transcriptional regulator